MVAKVLREFTLNLFVFFIVENNEFFILNVGKLFNFFKCKQISTFFF